MPTLAARVTKLEKKVVSLQKEVTKLKAAAVLMKAHQAKIDQWRKKVKKWGVKLAGPQPAGVTVPPWTDEVTDMLRQIDWARLATDYSGAGGLNPPQQPPDWPAPSEP